MQQPLILGHGETTLPRAYVYCARGKPAGNPHAQFVASVMGDPNWRVFELETGHNLYFSAPEDTARILLELAN